MVRKPVPRYNRKKPYQSRDEILKSLIDQATAHGLLQEKEPTQ